METVGNVNNSSNLVLFNALCSIPALVVPSEKSFHFDSNNTTTRKKNSNVLFGVFIVDEKNNLLSKISTRDLNFCKRTNK